MTQVKLGLNIFCTFIITLVQLNGAQKISDFTPVHKLGLTFMPDWAASNHKNMTRDSGQSHVALRP
jgi:hypothetical protein